VTDTTPVGALLHRPTPENPAYYIAVSAGYREFGGIVAGEKPPPKETVYRTFAKVLARQGYMPATNAHPPTLMLLWTWGTLNTDLFYDASIDPSQVGGMGTQVNRQQMLRFLGGYKLGLVSKTPQPFSDEFLAPGLLTHGVNADMLSDAATDDLFVAAIGAYDFAAAQHKEKKLLWVTKISCPSRGLALDQTLPAMMAIAGPNIGRETAEPVWINASDKFKPEVTIGDPKVVEYLDKTPLPVIESSDAPKKAPAKKK